VDAVVAEKEVKGEVDLNPAMVEKDVNEDKDATSGTGHAEPSPASPARLQPLAYITNVVRFVHFHFHCAFLNLIPNLPPLML
jgi:hypothetical protein